MNIDLPISTTIKSRARRRPVLLLTTFTLAFGLALATGLYYYLIPRGLNWNASQAALIAHIIGGLLAFVLIIPFTIAHQRQQEGQSRFLLTPWPALRPRRDEPTGLYRKRLGGHALHWAMLALNLTGLFMTLPALLWFAGVIWLPGYLAYRISNALHLGLTLVVVGLLLLHFTRRRRQQ